MSNKVEPLRRCVGCMLMKEKKGLTRLIREKNGEYKIDETGKINGRGAYICNDIECLKKAQKTRGFERSFKGKISENIYEQLHEVISKFVN